MQQKQQHQQQQQQAAQQQQQQAAQQHQQQQQQQQQQMQKTEADMSAFNKLLGMMKMTGALNETPKMPVRPLPFSLL